MTKSETAPGGTASRVVVAEDEALIRLDLVELLGEAGYDVVGQASNGEQAVELTLDLKPDLVIMDVKMPVMDGLSAAEEIGKQRLCPVIMLTAFSQAELVERARDAGVMAYIVKPFTAADLSPARVEAPGAGGRRSRRCARDAQGRGASQGCAHEEAQAD